MHYLQSYRFVFKSPNWLTNLLLVAVCSIIPVVGPIVLIGYLFEVIDAFIGLRLARRIGKSRPTSEAFGEQVTDALPVEGDYFLETYPDFNFNRFAEYLTRGIWPFLTRLIVGMIVVMFAVAFLILGMMIAGFAATNYDSPAIFFLIYALFWFVYVFLMLAMGILTTPIYLRAGLSCDFARSFSMTFYRDFMKRVGKEVVLAELFVAATGAVFTIVGLLMCYVGIFPAIALIQYAHHHLEYQLYELYLERGGEPVERKDKREQRYDDDESPSVRVRRPRTENRSTDVMRPEEE